MSSSNGRDIFLLPSSSFRNADHRIPFPLHGTRIRTRQYLDEQCSKISPIIKTMNETPKISVVVPLHNEAGNVGPLHEKLNAVMESVDLPYELLLVDDGSEDETFCRLSLIAEGHPRVRVIRLRRNFGQTAAFAAGIDHASGEVIVTIDGDLQNDPADIPRLLSKLDDGYDAVVGWRRRRKDALLTRRVPSILANWMIGQVTGVPIHDNGCSLKAIRATIARDMPLYSDMHRFMPAAAAALGARIAEIEVAHHPRTSGSSNYGLSRTYQVLLDLLRTKTILSFVSKPFFWFSMLAMPFGLLGAGLIAYQGLFLVNREVPLTSSPAVVGLLFLVLATMLVLGGMLAELIVGGGNYHGSKALAVNTSRLARGSGERRQTSS